jgi:hypothetical protein
MAVVPGSAGDPNVEREAALRSKWNAAQTQQRRWVQLAKEANAILQEHQQQQGEEGDAPPEVVEQLQAVEEGLVALWTVQHRLLRKALVGLRKQKAQEQRKHQQQ